MQISYKETWLEVIQTDITTLDVDCIINSANAELLGGAGVDKAIHEAAGWKLDRACDRLIRKFGRLQTTEALITSGFNLPTKYIMHVLAPVYHGGNQFESYKLIMTYQHILEWAIAEQFKTIAIPSLSTGIFKFPIEAAAPIAVNSVKAWIDCFPGWIDKIIFCTYEKYDFEIYSAIMERHGKTF